MSATAKSSILPLLPKETTAEDAQRKLAEDICNLQIPSDIQLSPNGGKKVLYSTALDWGHTAGKHPTSTLWLASTGQAKSSRQLTSGRFNDLHPRWSPDGSFIAFISDREKAGESAAIYVIPMLEGGSEPSPITNVENQSEFESFEFSPDGTEILFNSADEKSEERKKAEDDEEDGPQVWDEHWDYARLRIVNVKTKEVRCLTEGKNLHVHDSCWSPSGKEVAFTHSKNPNIEEQYLSGLTISTLNVASGEIKDLYTFSGEVEDLAWSRDGKLYFRSSTPMENVFGGVAVYNLDPTSSNPVPQKLAYGVEDDAFQLLYRAGEFFVRIAHGIQTHIRRLSDNKLLLNKPTDIEAFDVAVLPDSNDVVLAACLSDINHPDEVFTTTTTSSSDDLSFIQLSTHGAVLQNRTFGTWTHLTCPSADSEVELEAIFIAAATPPAGVPAGSPQPTFVMIHGGPTDRNTPSFNSYYFHWAPYLLSRGYSVFLPQYRGSWGRGESFANYSTSRVGEVDHADVITLTDHAIRHGLVDPAKTLVGGWSQGGFLTYLSSVRNGLQDLGWKFQAGVAGAGVSDADAMMLTSDLGSTLEPMLYEGRALWNTDSGDVRNRKASALCEVKKAVEESGKRKEMVIPPLLVLHGEKDERCPLSQAEGFRRALRAHGLPCEYVVYPRQGHLIAEQRFRVDMLLRIGRWCDTYIGSNAGKP